MWLYHGNNFLLFILLAEENNLYKHYGRMIAYMLIHSGPAPKFFSEKFYDMIVSGIQNNEVDIKYVGADNARLIMR